MEQKCSFWPGSQPKNHVDEVEDGFTFIRKYEGKTILDVKDVDIFIHQSEVEWCPQKAKKAQTGPELTKMPIYFCHTGPE